MNKFTKIKALTKKRLFLNKTKELILSSTIHGIPNILRTKKKSFKFMWLFLFVTCFLISIYMVYSAISSYLKYEVVTKIEIIHKIPLQFPAVTFINEKNPKANIKLKNLIISCVFNHKSCKENDFEIVQDKLGYALYRFKSRKIFNVGKTFGLQLVLLNNIINDYDVTNILDSFSFTIHDEKTDPGYITGESSQQISTSLGELIDISIKKEHISKLTLPYNNCIKNVSSLDSHDSKIYKYMLQNTKYLFSQKNCFNYCIGKEIYKQANISNKIDHWINVYYDNLNESTNLEKLSKNYFNIINSDINDLCKNECPLECDSVNYDTSYTSSKFSKKRLLKNIKRNFFKQYFNDLAKNLTEEDLDRVTIITVYYSDFSYKSIIEIPKMDFIDLIANIGGNLGLFIGVSFLSFAEIIELILEIFIILCRKKKQLNRKKFNQLIV
jgi:hypothetical protein